MIFLEAQLTAHNYTTGTKVAYAGTNRALKRLTRMTTTYPVGDLIGGKSYIAYGSEWSARDLLSRCVTLRHEMVHVRQARDMGGFIFTARYITFAAWRWALEMQAYRLSIACYKMAGVPRADLVRKIERIARSIRASYSLKAFSPSEVEQQTREALLTEI